MKGKDILIIPIEDMRKLMKYLVPQLGKEIYVKMQEAGVLHIFNKIQYDILEEEEDD